MTKAIFPGSFDPFTNGHLDILKRASQLFDEVIVAVGINTHKTALFDDQEKLALIEENIQLMPNVTAKMMTGLTAEFTVAESATHIVRGVRNGKDYEYERDLAAMNFQLGKIETVVLFASPKYQNISSTLLKEVARFGADISWIVPDNVAQAMKNKFQDD